VVVPDQQPFCWVQDGLVVTREESVPAETPDSNCSTSALWRERRNPLVDVAGGGGPEAKVT
jgi:hypothetical protein